MSGSAGKMDKDTVARDWHARGFSCDIWTDPPGQVDIRGGDKDVPVFLVNANDAMERMLLSLHLLGVSGEIYDLVPV